MHIPPGFLTPAVWAPMAGVSAASVGYALKRSGAGIDERHVPRLGVMAAFIFAAQMVNFPVAGGTSGHLMGAALAVTAFGLWPAVIIMTAVVIMQALLFQDGGLDALGANVFNMAIAGPLVAASVLSAGRRLSHRLSSVWIVSASWFSVMAAAFLCAVQLSLSGTAPMNIVLPAMLAVHAVIGLFEGIVTVVAVRFMMSVYPRMFSTSISENS